ncbi:hypothetical protein C8E99_0770 [Citricoccus muralis]|uniref:Uncharacterized protein n=1 Tax=Citricoccus muralis TaxID=169134 RepID=A0A3D9L9I9_9MICC|nr:hypothetical protein C8E99_0770 [Citricoccus muralis]
MHNGRITGQVERVDYVLASIYSAARLFHLKAVQVAIAVPFVQPKAVRRLDIDPVTLYDIATCFQMPRQLIHQSINDLLDSLLLLVLERNINSTAANSALRVVIGNGGPCRDSDYRNSHA